MEKIGWPLIVVALLTGIHVSENFEVTSPRSVTGLVGKDTLLSCQISSTKPLDNIEVQWKKITAGQIETVHLYKQQSGDIPGPKYAGRTVLPKDGFAYGNVSLVLKSVQPADEGTYSCIVKSRDWSADTTTMLITAATGKIFLEVLGPQGQGIKLACTSHGWFPKPVVHWVSQNEQSLSSDTAIHQDSEQLFNVQSQVTVTGEEMGEVTCQIQNTLMQTKKESSIRLSSAAFPQTSPWLFAFWILLVIFLLSIAAAVFMVFKERRKTSYQRTAEEEKLNKQRTQELEQQCDILRTELDFRKARSYMVAITLDKMQKHSKLTTSSDQRIVYQVPQPQKTAVEHQLPIVVAREGFSCGRQYWEVHVWDESDWEVGVMTEAVRQGLEKGSWQDLPEDGVWSLKRKNETFWPEVANTVIQERTEKPSLVGVDLDLSEHMLSFYDAAVSAYIMKLPIEGSTKFYPFFRPGFGEAGGKGQPLSINSDASWDFPQRFKTNKRHLQAI